MDNLRMLAANMTVDEIVAVLQGAQDTRRQSQTQAAHLAEQAKVIARLTARVEMQDRQLNWLRTQLFGARSERRLLEGSDNAVQLLLGEQLLDVPEEPPKRGTTVKAYERQHRKAPVKFMESDSRLRFDERVPVETIELSDPATKDLAEDQYIRIDEKVTYRLAQRSSYVVLKYVRPVVKLVSDATIVSVAAPPAIFDRSFADVSFLTGMAVDKFLYHLPLYRQHKRLQDAGVYVDRATLTRLIHRASQLLEPVYLAVLSSVLQSKVLAIDESPTPAGIAPAAGNKPGKIKQGYLWGFYGDRDEIALVYSPSRSTNILEEMLPNFEGTILTDGYAGYEKYVKASGTAHAQCWAHTRRKFVEAEGVAPDKVEHILTLMRQLWGVEERIAELASHERLRFRKDESQPLVDALFEFFKKERDSSALQPSNPFMEALRYVLAREHKLRLFLADPNIPIDTNHLERMFRGPAVGRKNWMFHLTEVGVRAAAIFYTLIQGCAINEISPSAYLTDVLQRVGVHPADEVELLTPRLWKAHFADKPLRSDVDRRLLPPPLE